MEIFLKYYLAKNPLYYFFHLFNTPYKTQDVNSTYIRRGSKTFMYPVGIGRKLNVRKTFRTRLGRLLNVLCTFSLRPVSTGYVEYTRCPVYSVYLSSWLVWPFSWTVCQYQFTPNIIHTYSKLEKEMLNFWTKQCTESVQSLQNRHHNVQIITW